MVFYFDKRGFGAAQYIGFKTHVAISIFEVSNITQYTFLSLTVNNGYHTGIL
jgi:hypothetical protein